MKCRCKQKQNWNQKRGIYLLLIYLKLWYITLRFEIHLLPEYTSYVVFKWILLKVNISDYLRIFKKLEVFVVDINIVSLFALW